MLVCRFLQPSSIFCDPGQILCRHASLSSCNMLLLMGMCSSWTVNNEPCQAATPKCLALLRPDKPERVPQRPPLSFLRCQIHSLPSICMGSGLVKALDPSASEPAVQLSGTIHPGPTTNKVRLSAPQELPVREGCYGLTGPEEGPLQPGDTVVPRCSPLFGSRRCHKYHTRQVPNEMFPEGIM